MLSQAIFVKSVQAYGYRIDQTGNWVHDHEKHTQYHFFRGEIIARNVEADIVEQRRRMSLAEAE